MLICEFFSEHENREIKMIFTSNIKKSYFSCRISQIIAIRYFFQSRVALLWFAILGKKGEKKEKMPKEKMLPKA